MVGPARSCRYRSSTMPLPAKWRLESHAPRDKEVLAVRLVSFTLISHSPPMQIVTSLAPALNKHSMLDLASLARSGGGRPPCVAVTLARNDCDIGAGARP